MKLNLTKRQWMLLIIYHIGYFLCGCCVSIQAPFYPKEAERKGVTPSQYGLVFGVFFLTAFIISPICGKVIAQIGAVLTSQIGLVMAGVTIILFGMLEKIYSPELFFAFSLITRIMESIGTMAFKISCVSIIAAEFPNNLATAFASIESCFGLGLIFGPPVGGLLYEWNGYIAPFFLIGILLLIAATSSAFLLSQVDEVASCQLPRKGFWLLLKQPEVLLGTAAILGVYLNISFLQATLEPHLRFFQMTPVKVSFMFIIHAVTYSIVSPLWGIIVDKYIPPQFVWSIGAILVSACFLLLGPAPYFPFQLTILMGISALSIHGIGQSAELVSAFHCFSKIAIKLGFPDDVSTYGITSALYNTSVALGGFIGPSLGGFLFDKIGFPWAVHVLIFYHIAVAALTLFYNFLYSENMFPKIKKSDCELKPIISNR